jgi:hypothetical protein
VLKKMIKKVFLLSAFIFITCSTNAQQSIHKNPFWLNVSLGGSAKYLNINASYNKALDNLSYQISLNGIKKNSLSNLGMINGNVGIGFAHFKDWLISSAYLGPSVSYGHEKTKSDKAAYFWGAGFALNAQAYFMPLHKLFPGLGLGVELFYNIHLMQTKDVDYRHVYTIRVGFCLSNIHLE